MTDADAEREDALYAVPPEQFVAARAALAKELREAGDRAGVRRVRALRRPTRAAWAINVAVRERPEAARELADAAAELGDAQRELLAGAPPERLRTAQARVAAAGDALLTALPVADAATLEKVRQTLRAAAVDPDALAETTSGRLLRERVVSGFGDLAGFVASGPAGGGGGGGDRAEGADGRSTVGRGADPGASARSAAAAAEQESAAKEAEQRAAELHARRTRAREEETAAKAAAAAARTALAGDEAALDTAHAALRDAQAAVDAAQAALRKAETTAARRREELDAAEARLAEATREREQADAD